ncbi:hypothetical protein F5Y14DRAFT_405119 [Nemania sp. NC0429]|nr:hypothetical protein F5Y14DRAFT_405119 [Nemania sp. NC0429]
MAELHKLFSTFSQFQLAKSGDSQSESLIHLIDTFAASNAKFKVVGEGFELAADIQGLDSIKEWLQNTFVPGYYNNLDVAQAPSVSDTPEVIGNPATPNSSFAIVFHSELTAKSGKPFVNDAVFVVKTNSHGKWADVKLYLDTLNVQKLTSGSA